MVIKLNYTPKYQAPCILSRPICLNLHHICRLFKSVVPFSDNLGLISIHTFSFNVDIVHIMKWPKKSQKIVFFLYEVAHQNVRRHFTPTIRTLQIGSLFAWEI